MCEAGRHNWSEAVLLPLFKKEDTQIYSYYRGLGLIDVAVKVFGVILLKRFQSEKEQYNRPNDSGFRPGRECTDRTQNLRRTLMQHLSFQQATATCFDDFASAFDSVHGDSLWQIMATDRMPQKLLGLIKAYCSSTKMKFRTNGCDLMPSEIRSGVP